MTYRTLKNVSLGTTVSTKTMLANTFFGRIKGLIGKRNPEDELCLIITRCNQVHTFFMNFPIHVVFLSPDHRVIKIIYSLEPKRVSPKVKGAASVLEIAAKRDVQTIIRIGDKLSIE